MNEEHDEQITGIGQDEEADDLELDPDAAEGVVGGTGPAAPHGGPAPAGG